MTPRTGVWVSRVGLACPHGVFSLSPPGVSTGSACPWMRFPTAASARTGTRGPCATRPGRPQTRAGACGACAATARPRPPRGRTACVTLAFRASSVSKVRGPPPDVPSPGSLPTTGFSNLICSSSQPQQPPPPPMPLPPALHLRLLLGFTAPPPPGSESHPRQGPVSPWPSFSCSPRIWGKCPCGLRSLLTEEIIGVTAPAQTSACWPHHLGTGNSSKSEGWRHPPWSSGPRCFCWDGECCVLRGGGGGAGGSLEKSRTQAP